mgnify:CR=1 FL=1
MEKLSSKGFFVLKSIVGKMDADGYVKLFADAYMPLVAEKVGEGFWADIHLRQLSLAHYGECNGDLMADPEMMFFFNEEYSVAIPFYYKNDYVRCEQFSISLAQKQYHVEMWLNNIQSQYELE